MKSWFGKNTQAAINTIQSLHWLRLAHGDLHAQNLMVKSESIVLLIDLDNVRKTRRRQQKDIARFTDSVKMARRTHPFC